jgi:hypothetical protein
MVIIIITIISKFLHMLLDGPICRLRLGVQKYKTSNQCCFVWQNSKDLENLTSLIPWLQ